MTAAGKKVLLLKRLNVGNAGHTWCLVIFKNINFLLADIKWEGNL